MTLWVRFMKGEWGGGEGLWWENSLIDVYLWSVLEQVEDSPPYSTQKRVVLMSQVSL